LDALRRDHGGPSPGSVFGEYEKSAVFLPGSEATTPC
jgi:hypothetical protein